MARQSDNPVRKGEIVLHTRLTPDECHERLWPRYRPVPGRGRLSSFGFARGAEAIALARGRNEAPVYGSAGVARFWFGRRGHTIHGTFERTPAGTRIIIRQGAPPGAGPVIDQLREGVTVLPLLVVMAVLAFGPAALTAFASVAYDIARSVSDLAQIDRIVIGVAGAAAIALLLGLTVARRSHIRAPAVDDGAAELIAFVRNTVSATELPIAR